MSYPQQPFKKQALPHGRGCSRCILSSGNWERFRGEVANVIDCSIVVNGFQLRSSYQVHFRSNITGKYNNLHFIPLEIFSIAQELFVDTVDLIFHLTKKQTHINPYRRGRVFQKT